MKIAKWITKYTIRSIISVVRVYFVFSLCGAFFKLMGRPTLLGVETPTWTRLLLLQAVCVAILAADLFLRSRLRDPVDGPQ